MEIPECLVDDILIRLPITSILRFKAVCKSWYAILSNPEFLYNDLFTIDSDEQILYKRHQNRTEEVFSLIPLTNLDQISPPKRLPNVNGTHDYIGYTNIAGCCNGIVLLKDGLRMCLWNPATDETKVLPRFELSRDLENSSEGDHNVGLCFDAKTSDFKVVLIFCDTELDKEYVYSLRSDCWKRAKACSPMLIFHCCSHCIAMNSSIGMCHWFWNYEVEESYRGMILSFDANRETFKMTDIPHYRKVVCCHMGFFMFKEYVAIREKGTKMYEIWAMLKVGVKESWIKVINIGPTLENENILRFWKNGKVFLETDYGVIVDVFDTFTGQTSPFLKQDMPCFQLAVNYKKSQVRLRELSVGTA